MRKISLLPILVMVVVLVACAAPISAPPIMVTQYPSEPVPITGMPHTYPYPGSGMPTTNPSPLAGTPTPDSLAYPAPATPSSNISAIPPSEYAPQAGDNRMRRDPVYLDLATSQLIVTDMQPVQVNIVLNGNLPDPSHVLRVKVNPADAQNIIHLEAYSLVPPGILTTQVLKSFSAEVPLGSYSSGTYTILVNGEELGKFIAGYAPQPGDAKLSRGGVTLDMSASEVVMSGTTANQATVNLSGELPDPCHELRISVNPPDSQNKIDIQVYSVFDSQMMCIMVIKPFEVSIPVNNLQRGHYGVYVNGQLLGEFDR